MIDGHTDTHTHTQATTIPEGQNWPRVKMANDSYFRLDDFPDRCMLLYVVLFR